MATTIIAAPTGANNPTAIGEGGTGATTAAGARTNLDVYSKTQVDGHLANKQGKLTLATFTYTWTPPGLNQSLTFSINTGFDVNRIKAVSIRSGTTNAIVFEYYRNGSTLAFTVYQTAGLNAEYRQTTIIYVLYE